MLAFCRAHDLWLIEDNCDALGSRYDGRPTGTFGDIATSSFYPPHHITMGEGGAVYTSNDELAEIAASLRDWGRDCPAPPASTTAAAGASRSSRRAAPRLRPQVRLLPVRLQPARRPTCRRRSAAPSSSAYTFTAPRRANHARLAAALAPLGDLLVLPRATAGSEPSWFGFLLTLRDEARGGVSRDAVVRRLEAAQDPDPYALRRQHRAAAVLRLAARGGSGYRMASALANTDRLMNDAFWVGVYPGLTEEMVDYVAAEIAACFEGDGDASTRSRGRSASSVSSPADRGVWLGVAVGTFGLFMTALVLARGGGYYVVVPRLAFVVPLAIVGVIAALAAPGSAAAP